MAEQTGGALRGAPIDPVCTFHGLRRSAHMCLYCCLCFRDLTPAECALDDDGQKIDVCRDCDAEQWRKVAQ